MVQRHFVGKASVRKVEHDLVWELKIKDRIYRWWGYDDRNWWKNYSTKSFYRQLHIDNESYEIDFNSGEVYLLVIKEDKDYAYELRSHLRIG